MDGTVISTKHGYQFLRVIEVAQYLGISRSKAYDLMMKGDIPTLRFGSSIRVRESDLEEYIQRSWSGWKQGKE